MSFFFGLHALYWHTPVALCLSFGLVICLAGKCTSCHLGILKFDIIFGNEIWVKEDVVLTVGLETPILLTVY